MHAQQVEERRSDLCTLEYLGALGAAKDRAPASNERYVGQRSGFVAHGGEVSRRHAKARGAASVLSLRNVHQAIGVWKSKWLGHRRSNQRVDRRRRADP